MKNVEISSESDTDYQPKVVQRQNRIADSLDLVDTSEQTLLEMTLKQKLTQRIKDQNY